MAAYYNEIDPFAAQWLRELINAGLIADGEVDERSIEDVLPSELAGFSQCHFFAGIGVWSYALRQAGWPDDRPVWTGSCPCQPFSAAGKRKGFADKRHLWPHFFRLISECRPYVCFGEQVASKDGLAWLDTVCADLEGEGYACGAVDTCAAGFGAPHIRQRLYWVAYSEQFGRRGGRTSNDSRQAREIQTEGHGTSCWMAHADTARREGRIHWGQNQTGQTVNGHSGCDGANCGLEYSSGIGWERRKTTTPRHDDDGQTPQRTQGEHGSCVSMPYCIPKHRPSPTNGFWANPDWLLCKDGKWRPVESGTFPLAHGTAARMGRLRGYGNAVNAKQAQAFIEAVMEVLK